MTIQHARSTALGLASILILVFFSAILLLPLSPLNSSALHDSSTDSTNCPNNNNNILVVNPTVTNMSNLDSTIPIVGIFSLEELILNNNNNNDSTKGSTFLIIGIVNVTKVDSNSSEQRVVEIQGRLDNTEPREQSMVIANISSVSANFTINEQSNNNNNTLDVILNDQRNTSLEFPLSSILNDNATSTTITNSTRIESNMMTIMAEIVRRLVHVDCSEEAIAMITNSRLKVMAQDVN